jgi:hypothetical protein
MGLSASTGESLRLISFFNGGNNAIEKSISVAKKIIEILKKI